MKTKGATFMKTLLLTLAAEAAETESSTSGGSTTESLKKIFTNPIFYIVLGAIVLLIIVIYLIRRMVKAKPNEKVIVVRHGKIHKILDENNPKYFLVPFVDSVGAVISLGDNTFASDKLFINDGPDALYKVNYILTYHVLDAEGFYPHLNSIQDVLNTSINDELRLFADNGNVLSIIKDYRQDESKILEVINKVLGEYHIEATAFKINFIEPLGKK